MRGDPRTSAERASALLARMTLTEKTRQVGGVLPNVLIGPEGLDRSALERHLASGIGHVASPAGLAGTPSEIAASTNAIQRYLVEGTRLGIPAMIHAEALNGFVAPGYTSFPTPIGLAATWDPEAVEAMSALIGRQMRSVGILQALSPVLDVYRDARWGRVHETYGEDVVLTTAMGVAYVRGLQRGGLTEGVLATAKHFLGYSVTEGGQNMAATHLGRRELYDVHATPFEAAIRLADLSSIMNSYSEIDGVPVGANRAVLTDLLRGRMGFTGTIVSDYMTIEWLRTRQLVASTDEEAGALALDAGIDVELPTIVGYGANLERAVRSGRIDEATLDDAVLRVLVDKFRVGLFDRPYVAEDPIAIGRTAVDGADLSRRLADESITLLKNDGVLPLARRSRVAVIGPHATSAMAAFAAYTYPATLDMIKALALGESRMAGMQDALDFLPEAAEQMAAEMAELVQIDTEAVVRHGYDALSLSDALRAAAPESEVVALQGVGLLPDQPQDVPAAVVAAAAADVVVLAIGARSGWWGEQVLEGEGSDVADIALPADQIALVEALAATGVPLVGVMFQGRPYDLSAVDDLLSGLLIAYYPGPHGTRSIAAVLYGDLDPSGRLPYTLPRGTGQVPIHVGQKHGSGYRRSGVDMFGGYVDLAHTPLYAFGHGLGYSTFAYGGLTLSDTEAHADGGRITAAVEITNTGPHDATEVVQLYVADQAIGVTRPALQLAAFSRVPLRSGERARVSFTVSMDQLGYSGLDGRFVLEPGPIRMLVGGASDAIRSEAVFTVIGATVVLEGRRRYLAETTITRLTADVTP